MKKHFFQGGLFSVILFIVLSSHSDCNLENPIPINNSDLISQKTVIRGTFENNPSEELEFVLIAPRFGSLFNNKYEDHLSFTFLTKPSTITDDRFMRMSQLYDMKLFIKYETDLVDLGEFGIPGLTYNTIFLHRTNPQPSPYHWSSAVSVTVFRNKITSLNFWTPKDWSLKERVSFCLKSGVLVEQANRPPADSSNTKPIRAKR